ncbi:hypothetical protein [Niveibacterium umoris]|uniref:DUF922 domain-containing protein n=1 Tax=Niveibacterium umoris TaxID=1193620 RepID=A0A840BQB0_9RHOO|nr:hypothetical protein [Niveibacterium umoris]MBB4013718.1 hypothetical protein [Niveibacterium umoris]
MAVCATRLPPTEIRVLTALDAPPVDNARPAAELALLRKQPLQPGEIVVGLTSVRQTYDFRWSYRGLKQRETGRSCLRSRIEVTLHLTQQVYVASEFAPGSCGYDEVIAHEQRHVAANLAQFERTARFVEDSLREQEGDAPPWLGEPDALRDAVMERARAGWMSQIETKFHEVDREHAKIDSVEESQRYKQLCNGEMERTLREIHQRETRKGR